MSKKAVEPEYKIIVDVDKVLWSDLDATSKLERAQHAGTKAELTRNRAERKLVAARKRKAPDEELERLEDAYMDAYDNYIAAIDSIEGIKASTAAMIDRVAAVTVDGRLTKALELPYSVIIEVQRQIGEAQKAAVDPNSKPD